MATDYTNLTLKIRAEARDLVYQNPITRETLGGDQIAVDGTNKTFYLANKNIVVGTINGVNYGPFVTLGASIRATGGFTVDSLNGILTFGSAPIANVSPRFVDYFFQWFQDADYAYWIDRATEELGMAAGSFVGPVTNGGDLTPALVEYGVERFWVNRASQYATKYATSTQGASEQIQSVTQNYLALAKAARTKGDSLRVNAYVDPGQKKKAASGTVTAIMSRYTPRP